jgi:hypothetical protein
MAAGDLGRREGERLKPSFRGALKIANPESSRKNEARGWIPGPAGGRPGMTLQVDHGRYGSTRSKIMMIQRPAA